MPWLRYSDDEVGRFHPEFEQAAKEVIQGLGLAQDYEWRHHLRTPGSTVIPDYVLVHRATNRWILAFELKRTRDSVYSTRFQIQAKGYSEVNQNQYSPDRPKYFALSNLEVTILFALNGTRPPRECRVVNGFFDSGRFVQGTAATHRTKFIEDLASIVQRAVLDNAVQFESVWPGILSDFIARSNALTPNAEILITEPTSANWQLVRNYFSSGLPIDSARVFLLRCLMAEYLRGILLRYGHPQAGSIQPVREDPGALARSIASLRVIDFQGLFEDSSPDLYRNLADPVLIENLRSYSLLITNAAARVVDLARDRVDYPQLIDDLLTTIVPVEVQDESGRVQTDPELAQLLATLAIRTTGSVLDPCCGDGVLLSAAYDRLIRLGSDNANALGSLAGMEADAIATRLASVRLALKEPAALRPNLAPGLLRADMFANPQQIASADFVLMNPPFKRYEEQDARPIPPELREHYQQCIENLGETIQTAQGQPNIFNYYVEYVGRAAKSGAIVGFILDNRWYHNSYGRRLRSFLLENFEILGLVEYPHDAFFANWSIATSLMIARKVETPSPAHEVKFIRCRVDPRSADLMRVDRAFDGTMPWPTDWTCVTKPQSQLSEQVGWRPYFGMAMQQDYRLPEMPFITSLFQSARRGSLEKEGSIGVLEFPYDRRNYGPRREPRDGNTFRTDRGAPLTAGQNSELRQRASDIPAHFRGWALRNSDDTSGYVLSATDVQKQQTIEPPLLRSHPELFDGFRRSEWTEFHQQALDQMLEDDRVRPYIEGVEQIVNLGDSVLPVEKRWLALREPYAGELIIPRKTRSGHRVYVNPFLEPQERRVRISSNFITYGNCIAIDPASGLDADTAVRLIAAFLISSFGQLQFEKEGVNREGVLSLEMDQFSRIKIFDPRWVRPQCRQRLLDALSSLPYPISTDRRSPEQPERNLLDQFFAEEIVNRFPQFECAPLVQEVENSLDEWIEARRP